jgi:glycyl-tRNA synthetase beta chain
MTTKNFLLELGTEELPPKSLPKLSASLVDGINKELQQAGITFTAIKPFAAPRRLAVLITDLAATQPDRHIEKRGPALAAAFDANGQPTKACEGFLRACQASAEQLIQRDGYVWFNGEEKGKTTVSLLPAIIQQAIQQLPIAKRMHWGNYDAEFVRPVHWIVMLYGNTVVPSTLLDHQASNITYGHRFHHPQAITLTHADDYEAALLAANVVADFAKRRDTIQQQIIAAAREVQGQAIIEEDLLNEVTALVEWPVALRGHFDERFLAVPQEALISSMQGHQKCFAIVDAQHNLLPYFITISNIASKDPQRVITGNERVMRARLSDAEFFYTTDLKQPLTYYAELLKNVVFQAQLGTLHDKAQRIIALAEVIAEQLKSNIDYASRAASLCKADLMTSMVGEFPELQGIAGFYYAKHTGEPAEVALAIKEHYLPRFAGDELPTTLSGCAVALADRLDTLVGIFGINQIPTGEKDPFALRRAALAILRIIIEHELSLDLHALISKAYANYASLPNQDTISQVFNFITERLRAWYIDKQIPVGIFAAVAAVKPTQPFDFHRRVLAVNHFCQLPEAEALAVANKRVSKILEKENQHINSEAINTALFEHDAERKLYEALNQSQVQITGDMNYQQVLNNLAALRQPIDTFFDQVMVMVDDINIRHNRLVLLSKLRNMFLQVADISLLQN